MNSKISEFISGYEIVLEVLSRREGSQLSFYSEKDHHLIDKKKFASVAEGLSAFDDLKEDLENLHNPT